MEELKNILKKIQKVVEANPEYKLEAYTFMMNALDHTLSKLPERRHVSGQELCEGIREYAVEQFGPLAKTVLEYWGLKETYDFGKIVFALIDAGLMSKTEEDSLEDFRDVYEFDDVFGKVDLGEE